jgi:hypothetical protein
MPDCHNQLVLEGPPAALSAVRDALASDTMPLDFERVLPPPDDLEGVHPHAWREDAWGTGRNLSLEDRETLIQDDPKNGILLYRFDTACTPPVGVVEHLTRQYPELDIVLVYHIPDECIAGKHYWLGGEEIESCEYDEETDIDALLTREEMSLNDLRPDDQLEVISLDGAAQSAVDGALWLTHRDADQHDGLAITRAQLFAAARWVCAGEDADPVKLRLYSDVLVVAQGEETTGFTTAGTRTVHSPHPAAGEVPALVAPARELKRFAPKLA